MIEDKEIGKSWVCSPLLPPPGEEVVKGLICKLIEERAQRINYPSHMESYQRACSDFGIDYAEYLKAKEQP